MKARGVAGNIERATEFLGELQEIDWRHYGQNGRSRTELAQMRARLEREQGARNPLKAAAGGYYDIDFALMYLRLKSAGFFFKVLNTPERIDTVEKMGHLEREEARFCGTPPLSTGPSITACEFRPAMRRGGCRPTGHDRDPDELVHRWTPALHEGTWTRCPNGSGGNARVLRAAVRKSD